VLAALAGRGPGLADGPPVFASRIDVSILASTLAVLVNQAQNAFVTRESPGRLGNAHPNIVPYETFATADGAIAIAVGSERQWPRFCEALGLGDLARDPRFATNGARVTHRAVLRPILAGRFAADPTARWLELLRLADVPCGPINDVLGAFESAQGRAIGARVRVDHPVVGRVDQVRSAVELDGVPPPVRRPPPMLGEHTAEVLAELDEER
jgi:crotonobetainyl-CoA:carnitine CoA-transferase CaiB-like acyl-CoA transferase